MRGDLEEEVAQSCGAGPETLEGFVGVAGAGRVVGDDVFEGGEELGGGVAGREEVRGGEGDVASVGGGGGHGYLGVGGGWGGVHFGRTGGEW